MEAWKRMKKINLSHMTWPEVRSVIQDKPTVLIPVGSTETQNLHNPTGYDYIVAEKLAEEAAKKCNAVVAPTVAYGYSDLFVGFPGTISLTSETLQSVFIDITKSLLRMGFDHLLFVNNHDPNHAPLSHAISKIRDEFGIVCASIWPTTIARAFAQDQFNNAKDVLVHGCEPSTSLLLYLTPDLVDLNAAKVAEKPTKLQNFALASAQALEHQGQSVPIFLRMHDVSAQGGWGDITQASADKGKVIFDRMVDFVATFIDRYNELDTRLGK